MWVKCISEAVNDRSFGVFVFLGYEKDTLCIFGLGMTKFGLAQLCTLDMHCNYDS